VDVKLRAIYISVLHTGRWSASPVRSLDPLRDLSGPQAATDEVKNRRDVLLGIRNATIHHVLTYLAVMASSIKIHATNQGHAIAQAVSRRLPTAAARVRAQVSSCGICGGQNDTGAGSLPVLRLPVPILIPTAVPHLSSSIIRGWYSRPISGRRTEWTQSHPTQRN
jgi:hypothetical protein